jgi:hypothetical protein
MLRQITTKSQKFQNNNNNLKFYLKFKKQFCRVHRFCVILNRRFISSFFNVSERLEGLTAQFVTQLLGSSKHLVFVLKSAMDRSEAALDTIMQDINPRRRNPASLESRSSLAANARYVVGDPLFTANGMHSHDKFSDRTPREISAKRSVNGREISNVPLTDRHLKVQNESHGYKSRSPPGLLDIPQETAQEFLSYSRSNAQSDEEASSHMRSPLSARDTQSYTRRNVQSDGEANGYMRQPPSHTSQGMYGELSSMAYRESPRRRSGSWTERQFEGSPMSKRMPQRTLTVQKGQIAKFLDETRPDEFYHRATRQNPALYDAWTNWRRAESISQKLKDLKTLCDGKDLAQTRSQQSGGDHGSNKRSPVKQPQVIALAIRTTSGSSMRQRSFHSCRQ